MNLYILNGITSTIAIVIGIIILYALYNMFLREDQG
jgi:hypothetical protein